MYRDPAVCWTVFQEPGTQQKMKMTKFCLHKPFIPAGPRHSSKLLENNECYGKTKQVEKKKRETEMQNGGIRVFYKILRFFFFLTARQHAQIDERKNFQLLIAPNKRRLLCYTGPCVVLSEMGCQWAGGACCLCEKSSVRVSQVSRAHGRLPNSNNFMCSRA